MLDLVTGYTPGPWKVHLVDDTSIVDGSGAEVANVAGDYNQPETWPVMEANARLIASAPDMVDEIIRLRKEVDTWRTIQANEAMEAGNELTALREMNERLVKLVDNIKTWADARCPCENEKPNPCPLCGADAEKPNDICLAAENTIPGSILQEIRDVLSIASGQVKHAPPEPDWFWRDLDPDDSGDSPHDALWQTGEGVVSLLKSSYAGPSFYAAIVPVLDASSDDTEVIRADTEEACVAAVDERLKARAAIPQGGSNG